MNDVDWTTANQRVLVAEFARIRARIAGEDAVEAEAELARARETMPSPASIDMLTQSFGLSSFERDILLMCAGVEMGAGLKSDPASEGFSASAENVTFGTALARFAEPHWSALTPVRPLRRRRLIELRDGRRLCSSRLHIDERVLHFLAGLNYLDTRLAPLVRRHQAEAPLGDKQTHVGEVALRSLDGRRRESSILQLYGTDLPAQREIARRVARQLGLDLHGLSWRDVPANVHEAHAFAQLWSREALLLRTALFIEIEDGGNVGLSDCLRHLEGLVFLVGHAPVPHDRCELRFQVDRPEQSEQRQLWRIALGERADSLNGSLDSIAARYRVSTDIMMRAGDGLRTALPEAHAVQSIVVESCRDSIRRRLDGLAERIEPAATWRDLVLPDAQLAALHEIAGQVRGRARVHEEWGFARTSCRGLGITALFSGESGTGKTMAAEVLANELQLDLYRIDLASMVSKYIGETEKNLRRVFDAAEDGAAILLFDEADALFGKRSEVNDSHDRYANIEVSYLLQRMEAYRGLAILTTNLKSALDTGFQRRLRFVLQFPFPDPAQREHIWRGVFPAEAPTTALDFRRLAQLNVSGGSIRNIALNAAFLAAGARTPVDMSHLLRAARSDALKRERPFSDAETRGWA
jgi:ATPase family associated with various cellular activities (AAA)